MSDRPDLFGGHTCPTCHGTGRVDADTYRRMIEDRPGAVGRDHPETSHHAAKRPSNIVRFGTQRYYALSTLLHRGPSTAAEIAAAINVSRNQTATRMGELRESGLVEYVRLANGDFMTRSTGPDDEGRVQRITDAGCQALELVRR